MLFRSLVVASAVMLAPSVWGQQTSTHPMSAAEVLKQAQQGASDVEQLRAALHSPDPSTRLATMNAMLHSNNPALVSSAISEGNASSDVDLRNLAVRAAFRELTGFTLQPTNPLPDDTAKTYSDFTHSTGGLKIQLSGYDPSSGVFQGYGSLRGQISYGRLEFQDNTCNAVLLAKSGSWRFEGRVDCRYGAESFSELMWVQIR